MPEVASFCCVFCDAGGLEAYPKIRTKLLCGMIEATRDHLQSLPHLHEKAFTNSSRHVDLRDAAPPAAILCESHAQLQASKASSSFVLSRT